MTMITNGTRKSLFAFAVWTLTAAGATVALTTAAPAAHAEQVLYRGVDARYSNIKMDLYLPRPGSSGIYDATGSVYLGSTFRYTVKGTFSGSALTANVSYVLGSVPASVGLSGGLSGGPVGKGTLTVATGMVPTGSGAFNSLTFTLF